MLRNKKYLFLFLCIFLLGAVMRLYGISKVPPGVNRDDASIGFTAYSLLHTGKDEYGSAILLALGYFTYAGNYVFTTLLVIGLFLFYRNTIPKTKFLWISLMIFFVLCGFIWYQTTSANHTKLSGIGIFGDPSVVHAKIE